MRLCGLYRTTSTKDSDFNCQSLCLKLSFSFYQRLIQMPQKNGKIKKHFLLVIRLLNDLKRIAMSKIYVLIISILTFTFSVPISATIHSQQVHTINPDRITFNDSIEYLSQLFGIKIVIIGDKTKLSKERFTINLEQATLEQSIKEIMRRAKVQNHAWFLDINNKVVQVWILSAETKEVIGSQARMNRFYQGENEPLSMNQMHLLAQHTKNSSVGTDIPLTPEQTEQLQEQSIVIEVETEDDAKSLTLEQIDQLQEQSLQITSEMEKSQGPLSTKEMKQLHKHPVKIQPDDTDLQPLSKEQFFLLKKQEE